MTLDRRARSLLTLMLAILVLTGSRGAALAQSCSLSMSNVSFGQVDLTDNTAYDTSANYSASCSGGTPGATLRLCPNLGAGSGGANGANAPRYMVSGANQLGYNLFSDAGRTSVWGSYLGGGNPPEIMITLDGAGSGSAAGSIYARIYAGQQSLPPGSYASSYAGGQASLSYADQSAGDCTAIGATNATSFSFDVTASYLATCTVVGGNMDFGSAIATLSSPIDASASLSTTCSASSPYTIGLGDGLAATGAMQRNLSFDTHRISYHLYQNVARTTPWGNAVGDRVAGTGSGSAQSHTVYGRIPPQSTPAAGTYTDTVIVTVTY